MQLSKSIFLHIIKYQQKFHLVTFFCTYIAQNIIFREERNMPMKYNIVRTMFLFDTSENVNINIISELLCMYITPINSNPE